MTYNELIAELKNLTEEQRKQKVLICDFNKSRDYCVEDIISKEYEGADKKIPIIEIISY